MGLEEQIVTKLNMCPFFSLDAVRCTSATLPNRSLEVEEFSEYKF